MQNETDPGNPINANWFKIKPEFNDLLLFFHEPKMEERPFKERIVTKKGVTVLETTWGNFQKNEEEISDETIKFIEIYKNQVETQFSDTIFYFNDQLKPATGYYQYTEEASIFNIINYVLDEASNKFIRKGFYKKRGELSAGSSRKLS